MTHHFQDAPSHEDSQPQVETALEVLTHFHLAHTTDKITRFTNKVDGKPVAIYITSDPQWVKTLETITVEEF